MSKTNRSPQRGGRPASRVDNNPRQRHVPAKGTRARAGGKKAAASAKGAKMGGDDSAASKTRRSKAAAKRAGAKRSPTK
ncbi:MAG: hypothetical protein FJX64_11045 [Alphaproteobacteria bacterium]|nr:hypothetical protein [Alphaproteobacteria bacterium]